MKVLYKIVTLFVVFLLCLPFSSCKKLIEIDPPIGKVIGTEIYKTNSGAISVLSGIYIQMNYNGFACGTSGISFHEGLSADELTLNPAIINDFNGFYQLYRNEIGRNGDSSWLELYAYIFKINAALEGLNSSSELSNSVKQQLIGEAKFMRAFLYFYLANLYGNVPMLKSTDPNVNGNAPRVQKSEVYLEIIADLIDAQSLLNANYVGSDAISNTSERVRPNKAVATALLARVYLFTNQWQKAEVESTKIIDDPNYKILPLKEVFLKESKETIWSLERTNPLNAGDGFLFILPEGINTNTNPVFLSNEVIKSFEPGDSRKTTWTGSYTNGINTYPYAFKYKEREGSGSNFTENTIVLRLAEIYLIRAEARAQQGTLIGSNSASTDLNVIRGRAGLLNTTKVSQPELLNAILHERQVELFTEWGHRWFDLKRTGKIDEIMVDATKLKGGSWSSYKALYPLPVQDILRNPSLRGNQNPGYPEQ